MIGNTGFEMTPAAEVSDLIEKHLHGWLTEWLASAGASVQQVHSWALQPAAHRDQHRQGDEPA